jgi:hypothetical protein
MTSGFDEQPGANAAKMTVQLDDTAPAAEIDGVVLSAARPGRTGSPGGSLRCATRTTPAPPRSKSPAPNHPHPPAR